MFYRRVYRLICNWKIRNKNQIGVWGKILTDDALKPPPPDFSTRCIFSKPKKPPRAIILSSRRLFHICNIFLRIIVVSQKSSIFAVQ